MLEAKVVLDYLNDIYRSTGPSVGATTPEGRALAGLITQVVAAVVA